MFRGRPSQLLFPASSLTIQTSHMLKTIGMSKLEDVTDIVPADIRLGEMQSQWGSLGEHEMLTKLKRIASQNQHTMRSFIGLGYYGTVTPNVILRNLLENPAWYTPYTPYQAEVPHSPLSISPS